MGKTAIEQLQDSNYKIVSNLLRYAGIEINGSKHYDIQVNKPDFYNRVLRDGSLGLGESYMEGWWDCERIDMFIEKILTADLEHRVDSSFADLLKIVLFRLFNMQSKKRAWQVGKEHYDLGNDLFESMLDPHMQYSCGYWKGCNSLEEAQENKLKLICEKLKLKPDQRLLDIGCGWGGLSAYAARNYGVTVVGVTISKEQKEFSEKRCKGLNVDIRLQDYRDLKDKFDRIVSVGMFEHVGFKNYGTYFDVVKKNLKSDGLFLLHTIGSNEDGVNVDRWINKYIFPNGQLPSMKGITTHIQDKFVVEDWHNFGAYYDLTLMSWYERFLKFYHNTQHNYSENFKRMFTYYLNACAGAFRSRRIQLWQILLSSSGIIGGIDVPR